MLSQKDLDKGIRELSKERKTTLYAQVNKSLEKFKEKYSKEKLSELDGLFSEDLEEMDCVCAMISPFINPNKSDYRFIRTEPLAFLSVKNFDIFLFNRKTKVGLLVEHKEALSRNCGKRVGEFLKKKEVVAKNTSVVCKHTQSTLKAKEILGSYVGADQHLNIEYILASDLVDSDPVKQACISKKENLVLWVIRVHGDKSNLYSKAIFGDDKKAFPGHVDPLLKKFIKKWHVDGFDCFKGTVSFMFSSSNLFRAIQMIIPLTSETEFNFISWQSKFNIELNNYTQIEKEILFEKFIEYGHEYGLVADLDNAENIYERKYRVVTARARDPKKLIVRIKEKIAKKEALKKSKEKRKLVIREKFTEIEKIKNEKVGQKFLFGVD